MAKARRRGKSPAQISKILGQSRPLSRHFPALAQRRNRQNHPLFTKRRRWRCRGISLPLSRTALRAGVFRSSIAQRNRTQKSDQLAMERLRMELVHPKPKYPLLALESQQRLEHEAQNSRLERMPHRLRHGCIPPAFRHLPQSLSQRMDRRQSLQKWQNLPRCHPPTGLRLRWTALLLTLQLFGFESHRTQRQIRQLFRAKCGPYPHQLQTLSRKYSKIQRIRPWMLGINRLGQSFGLCSALTNRRFGGDFSHRSPVRHALFT